LRLLRADTETKGDAMAGPVVGPRRFAVYPQPPIQPLPVAAGATGEIALSEQLAGPTVEGEPYAQMMFLRVAAHGGTVEPTFTLIAGDGDPVTLSDTASAIHRGGGDADYVGGGWVDGREPDGVYRIYVGFEAVSPAPEQWRLRIRNNDPNAGYSFTAVMADTPDGSLQPWIDVSSGLDFDLLAGPPSSDTSATSQDGRCCGPRRCCGGFARRACDRWDADEFRMAQWSS
jgi:hypothetical protein